MKTEINLVPKRSKMSFMFVLKTFSNRDIESTHYYTNYLFPCEIYRFHHVGKSIQSLGNKIHVTHWWNCLIATENTGVIKMICEVLQICVTNMYDL